jgi:hypothetical protein
MSEIVLSESTVEQELSHHGSYASLTSGNSMSPLFKTHRDVVVLVKPEEKIKKYDVVLYHRGERKNILHRVIGERGEFFIIRGDNTYKKELIRKDDILAVMVSFTRRGKRHKVTDFSYKLYSRFWNFIYPVRFLIRGIYLSLAKLYRKIFPKKKK